MTTFRASGFTRRQASSEWEPAAFDLCNDELVIVLHWHPPARIALPLMEISAVDAIAPPAQGSATISIRSSEGVAVAAVAPETFVDELCTELRSTMSAPRQPTDRRPVPTGPVPVSERPRSVASVSETSPTPPTAAPVDATSLRDALRDRAWIGAVAMGVVILVLVGLAVTARRSAVRAHARTDAVTQELAAANAEVEATSEQLVVTSGDLDMTRQELIASRGKVTALEGQIADLTERISGLSNDKAKVQDEKRAAEVVSRLANSAAEGMLECRNRLLDAMGYVVDRAYSSATRVLDAALPVCQRANSEVAALKEAVGS